ncbi:dolichol-phosphate mannosyltransferase [Marivirga sericea]|uniref:Dolichol-phosphate mannosyltransferase n=1 Tax=Marivirga sericea TaxID=1028 RepID=A0A1X7J8I3_9BACT|nr:glycosyltransferase family 2 protein [Marivirga sericea]SMG23619.1 dolichol-phosphate mannosyltransferase [Marivirga sericea]
MPKISVVSPVYRAEKIIPELISRIKESVENITMDYEIILVEDNGPDDSWQVIENLAQNDETIIGIKLSRNFGQHYAITAGLDASNGDWVVVMDCDLQDQPEEIPNLYSEALKGYDIVLAQRHQRRDSFFKRFFSAAFYRVLGYLTGSKQDESIANFGIYSKKVIDAVKSMRESIRYFPTMVKWVGFKSTKLKVKHNKRSEGETSYNMKKLLNLALDIILAFSDKPIRLAVKLGLLISAMSLVISIVYLAKYLAGHVVILGYTSLIISIWLLSGLTMATLGLVGLYIGKTFEGVKQRPIYIIEKKIKRG